MGSGTEAALEMYRAKSKAYQIQENKSKCPTAMAILNYGTVHRNMRSFTFKNYKQMHKCRSDVSQILKIQTNSIETKKKE